MSMYGDGNYAKNDLFDEIKAFLQEYSVGDLLEVVTDAVKVNNGEY